MIDILVNWGGQIIAALIGAFVGAGAAFLLQMRREKRLKADEEYAAIIRAQHALLFMHRILARIQSTYLDKQRTSKTRHQELSLFWLTNRHYSIDLDSLTFLFRPKMRALLSNCFFTERAFQSAMEAVEERNASLTAITSRPTEPLDTGMSALNGMVNPRFAAERARDAQLKSATDELYKAVDNGLKLCQQTFADLRKDAKMVYPKRDFLTDENLTEAAIKKDFGLQSDLNPELPPA
jgi:hypothetical protein